MALALLDVKRAQINARSTYEPDSEEVQLLDELSDRKLSVESEQALFSALCDRWDNLYYPQHFTAGGASHWADHVSARKAGMSHISLNVYPSYVDIPAGLQAVEPIENMMANDVTVQARMVAAMGERLYRAWKREEEFELAAHKACVVKGLYGRTAAKVFWDDESKHPKFEIVDQPRNLYLGWRDSNYTRLEWAIYTYSITPMTALEDWGVRVEERLNHETRERYPYVTFPTGDGAYDARLASADLRVEVYDYWYRKPKPRAKVRFGKPTKFETWNAIFVGNVMVKNQRHTEYDGQMPYVPLFNTYIPGLADGRSEFYDVEHIIREKDEKISEISQMMSRAIKGQYWQLTGQEAPDTVPGHLKPTPNAVIAPGAGNRIEPIAPWMPEFQAEGYLSRLDREMVEVTGLNDLLRGLAPGQVMSSGKAIAALVANYETRIRMKRDVFYRWRKEVWSVAKTVWGAKVSALKPILDAAWLDVRAPSLTPRDDLETMNLAASAKEQKLWSQQRAMDAVGVDDPEAELDVIRAEQTDATLNPANVQVMLTLMATAQQLGVQMQQLQQQAQMAGAAQGGPGPATMEQMANDQRQLAPQVAGSPELNAPEEQAIMPGEQMPGNTPEGAALGAGAAGPSQMLNQTMVQEGEATSRIVGQNTIQKSGR